MPVLIQHLRTPTGTALPATLESGQIAFNLANNWMLVGNGGGEILADGAPLTTYGGPLTVLGVAAVVVPAKPAVGKGYEIFKMIGTPAGTTSIYSITDALVAAEAGAATTADKIVAALIKRSGKLCLHLSPALTIDTPTTRARTRATSVGDAKNIIVVG